MKFINFVLLFIYQYGYLFAQEITYPKCKIELNIYKDSLGMLDPIPYSISINNIDTTSFDIYHGYTPNGKIESGTTYLEYKTEFDTVWRIYQKVDVQFEINSKPVVKLNFGQTVSSGYLEVLPAQRYIGSPTSYEPLVNQTGVYYFRAKFFPLGDNQSALRNRPTAHNQVEYLVSDAHKAFIHAYISNEKDFQAFRYLISTSKPLLLCPSWGENINIIKFNLIDSDELQIAKTIAWNYPESKFAPWACYALLRSEARELDWHAPRDNIEKNLATLKRVKTAYLKAAQYHKPELTEILKAEYGLYYEYFFRMFPDPYEMLSDEMIKEYLEF